MTEPTHVFVESIPDLIEPSAYREHPRGGLVRVRLQCGPNGIEVLGDAMRPDLLTDLLQTLGADVIDQMLCG